MAGQGDVKPLQGREGYRLRIGSYRVIFDEDAVTILAIFSTVPAIHHGPRAYILWRRAFTGQPTAPRAAAAGTRIRRGM